MEKIMQVPFNGQGKAFRVCLTGRKTFRVESSGDSRVWRCECREFYDSLRTGKSKNSCRHITTCMDKIRRKPRPDQPEIPGVACPCGCISVRPSGSRDGNKCYLCHECGRKFSKTAKSKIKPPDVDKSSQILDEDMNEADVVCTHCGSTVNVKAGMSRGRQLRKCRACKKRFVECEPGYKGMTYSPETVSTALNAVMSGMSYRKASEHIWSTTGRRVAHNTIMYWTSKYTAMIKAHVDALTPMTGRVWSVDEAYLNVKRSPKTDGKKRGNWLWSAIDPSTRLLLATRIAEGGRRIPDARAVLAAAKRMAGGGPDYLVTDSNNTYVRASKKEVPDAVHVMTKSIRDGFTNMAIERYHNEIREKLKSCRGLGTRDSAQVFCDLLRIHHNFVRPHMGMDGRTPAEAAGIATPGVRDAKYKALIRAAARAEQGVAGWLGGIAAKVDVVCDGDTFVSPREWLDNEEWGKVNQTLTGLGFYWVFTQLARYWVLFDGAPQVAVTARTASGSQRGRTPI